MQCMWILSEMTHEKTNQAGTLKTKFFQSLINKEELSINRKNFWMLENVLKHKSCLDPLIKNYGSIDFTLIYTKCGIE